METLKKNRSLFFVEGILFMLLGLIAIAVPTVFTFGIEILFGCLLLTGGLLQGYRAYKLWKSPGFYTSSLAAILSLLLGFIFLLNPLKGVLTLTLILMFFFFVGGLFKIFMSFELRPLRGWGWVLTNGILGVLMAFIIYSGWPGSALWLIGLLLGIDMLFFGVALIYLAAAIKE